MLETETEPQMSVATGNPSPPATVESSQQTWMSAGQVITGAVVSWMMKEAEVDVELPQSSVAVKVTKDPPVAPQSSERAVKLLDQTTPEQISEAEAPP